MGLLNDLAGSVLGGGSQNQLAEMAMNLIANSEAGGLAGLVKTFTERGLGEAVSSWVGTGRNQAVSGEQIAGAIGLEQVATIAQKLGIGNEEAANGLAGLLPGLIDKLTPDGQVPDSDMLAQGVELLKGKLFGQ